MKRFENIVIDEQLNIPIYKQIRNSIVRLIDRGILSNGDVLHPERTLSEALDVSRGTVRKAYGLLQEQGMIMSRRGGGYYVSGADKVVDMHNQKAKQMFSETILRLLQDGHLPNDIFSNFKHSLLEMTNCSEKISVVVVECREEIRYVFERFFSAYPDVSFSFFVLDDLNSSDLLVKQLEESDLILTTASHYYDLCVNYPECTEKILEIVILWTADTMTRINHIPPGSKIGCIYNNSKTIWLIKSALKYFGVEGVSFDVVSEKSIHLMEEFVRNHNVLIAEPDSVYFSKPDYEKLRHDVAAKGGINIAFEHYIDTASVQNIFRAVTNARWNKWNQA